MKQKNSKQLTEQGLKAVLKPYATKKDLEEYRLATKKDLDKKFEEQDEKMDEKMDERFQQYVYRLEEMYTQWRSDFYTKIDPLLSEIEDNREHRAIESHESEEIKQQLDNHEKRITKLENS